MVNIKKQVEYWITEGENDLAFAKRVIARDSEAQYGLFFVHLALEKILKAHVCKRTNNFAPKIHNLVRLAEIGNVSLSDEQIDFLGRMNRHNIEGRYPDMDYPTPSVERAKHNLEQAQEIIGWLKDRL
jgi:HEPN domain-containing protein